MIASLFTLSFSLVFYNHVPYKVPYNLKSRCAFNKKNIIVIDMSVYHHRAAQIVSDQILYSWRNKNKWINPFISNKAQQIVSPNNFPSPDALFQDIKKKTKISLEFKPYTESKRGIMTGLGQAIAYLNRSHASILVCSSEVDGFKIGNYLTDTFEKFIYGKLPIALFTYDGEHLENLKLAVDIEPKLFNQNNLKQIPFKIIGAPYFAFWRELPVNGFYKLSKSAQDVSSKTNRSEKVWDEFFYNYYAPREALKTLDDIESNIYWDDMVEKMIPFSSRKKSLRLAVANKEISEKEALKILEKKSWSKKETDNNYRNYKKNFYNFMNHNSLWDESFYLTPLGTRFVERYENNIKSPQALIDEMAQILLVEGKHHNLIEEIKDITNESFDNDTKFIEHIYKEMDKRGHVAKNPERKTSGSREYLVAEKQLWGRFGLIKKNGNTYFNKNIGYVFENKRIDELVEKYYINYGDVNSKKSFDNRVFN
jgi:hypothetical protein